MSAVYRFNANKIDGSFLKKKLKKSLPVKI